MLVWNASFAIRRPLTGINPGPRRWARVPCRPTELHPAAPSVGKMEEKQASDHHLRRWTRGSGALAGRLGGHCAITLVWQLQCSPAALPIPRPTTPHTTVEEVRVTDVELSDDEVATITKLLAE